MLQSGSGAIIRILGRSRASPRGALKTCGPFSIIDAASPQSSWRPSWSPCRTGQRTRAPDGEPMTIRGASSQSSGAHPRWAKWRAAGRAGSGPGRSSSGAAAGSSQRTPRIHPPRWPQHDRTRPRRSPVGAAHGHAAWATRIRTPTHSSTPESLRRDRDPSFRSTEEVSPWTAIRRCPSWLVVCWCSSAFCFRSSSPSRRGSRPGPGKPPGPRRCHRTLRRSHRRTAGPTRAAPPDPLRKSGRTSLPTNIWGRRKPFARDSREDEQGQHGDLRLGSTVAG